jgi:hypothetical protein
VVDLFSQFGVATGYYQFDGGGMLLSDGPATLGGIANAVVGGTGTFSGASGEVTGGAISTNSTGFPNLRMTFKLNKVAPE